MKLRVMRYSGKPVTMENLSAYEAEFKTQYDAILAEHGPDMLVVHEKLIELDKELAKKWNLIESHEVPKSAKAWHKLLESYDCPIMLAKSSENPKELLLIIMDQPLA